MSWCAWVGDEFVVILKGVTHTGKVSETRRAHHQALNAPMVVDGRTLVTTVSIGVSLYPHDGADMGELLRHSDTAIVPGERPRPQQLPALQPRHGPQAERAHRA